MSQRPDPPNHCRRCGTCCRKGGPALHHADLPLLRDTIILREALYTLRVGEPVHDQVKGQVVLLDAECVKVRSKESAVDSSAKSEPGCRFYLPDPSPAAQASEWASGRCAIHENKPQECAALKCWDTAGLAEAAATPRLSRLDILGPDNALAELVRDHETHCSVADLLRHLQAPTPESADLLRQAAAYDAALRDLLQAKAGIPPDHLPFLLGRPLPEVIHGLRRWLARNGDHSKKDMV
ncbi:YkgJ family cysteine cluster protein [Desulfonatronum lacustre]|uniref:YkgJ family cysteine cluster protein n=1 Tax=Desulfonatronum lacustre TaxID=66849 RepID=UPI0004AFBE2D|nr:flagellar protein FliT [Desulfonatronum lacustre]